MYEGKRADQAFDELADTATMNDDFIGWQKRVVHVLGETFPTDREAFMFLRADRGAARYDSTGVIYPRFWGLVWRAEFFVRMLDFIRLQEVGRYTDLPIGARLYVEDIDSFSKVRDLNHAVVADVLDEDGRVELSEDHV